MDLQDVVWGLLVAFVVLLSQHIMRRRTTSLKGTPPKPPKMPRGFTEDELAVYDGVRNRDIYLGCKGIVFQVSSEWYGPDSAYHVFAGKEASRQLGKVVVNSAECNADWVNLAPLHLQQLDEWYSKFKGKYEVVGWFIPPPDYEERAKKFEP